MSTSSPSYKDYSFSDHAVVYKLLEQVCGEFDIHYYLIGANARDVALYKAGTKPTRGTADVDFAVMLPAMEDYEAFKDRLKEHGFEDTFGNTPFRLFFKSTNTVIDLLPYGQIAQQNTVHFTERNVELSTVGLEEVGKHVEAFELEPGLSIPVSPAHGLVILKLIAWSEKPSRSKDLADIATLLEAAWGLYEDELFLQDTEHGDVFEDTNFDTEVAGAIVMGRKMNEILIHNVELKKTLSDLIIQDVNKNAGPISVAIARAMKKDIAHANRVLGAIHSGISVNQN
jgi:predicted nucleotidyltransferase